MLPVIASVNTFNFQTPLVNTATPGSGVVHVPYDNVAPSVSSAQVDNNTTANNSVVSSDSNQAATESTANNPPVTEDNSSNFSSLLQGSTSGSGNSSGVQSTFVAQLAAQDDSPQTQVILVQYEKLIADSNVKYKPSNALKPPEAPAGVFGRILQAEKASPPPVQQTAPKVEAPAPANTNSNEAQASAEITALPVAQALPASRTGKPANQNSDGTDNATTTTGSDTVSITDAMPPHVINAYTSTAGRVDSFNNSSTELV